jgi:hypothetical protein
MSSILLGMLFMIGNSQAVSFLPANDGFEIPNVVSGVTYNPTDTGVAWVFDSNMNSGITGNGSSPLSNSNAVNGNKDGTTSTKGQAAFIFGGDGNFGSSATTNSAFISQSFTLIAAANVTVKFRIRGTGDYANPIKARIVNSTNIYDLGQISTSDTNFMDFTSSPSPQSLAVGTYTLYLAGTVNNYYYRALLDNVQIIVEACTMMDKNGNPKDSNCWNNGLPSAGKPGVIGAGITGTFSSGNFSWFSGVSATNKAYVTLNGGVLIKPDISTLDIGANAELTVNSGSLTAYNLRFTQNADFHLTGGNLTASNRVVFYRSAPQSTVSGGTLTAAGLDLTSDNNPTEIYVTGGIIDVGQLKFSPYAGGGGGITFADGGTLLIGSGGIVTNIGIRYLNFLAGASNASLIVSGYTRTNYEALYASNILQFNGTNTSSFSNVFRVDGSKLTLGRSISMATLDAYFANPPNEYQMISYGLYPATLATYTNYGLGGYMALFYENLYTNYNGTIITNTDSSRGITNIGPWVGTAKAQDMAVWLADDFGFPSGMAGGLVVAANTNWEVRGMAALTATGTSNGAVNLLTPTNAERMISAVLYPFSNGIPNFSQGTTNGLTVSNSGVTGSGLPGPWKLYAFVLKIRNQATQCQDTTEQFEHLGRYPDIMNPDAVQNFISNMHEKITGCISDYPSKVKGFYYMEPSLMQMNTSWTNPPPYPLLPWTPALTNKFYAMHGYSLTPVMAALYEGDDLAARRIRINFYQTIGELVRSNFTGQIASWCAKRGLSSAGHYLMEENLSMHVLNAGDQLKVCAEMLTPTIDVPIPDPDIMLSMDYHFTRQASSLAMWKKRDSTMILLDPLIGGYRDRTLPMPKTNYYNSVNMAFRHGINTLSTYGTLGSNENQLAETRELNKYIGRTALLLRGAQIRTSVALYYPISMFQADFFASTNIYVTMWNDEHGSSSWRKYTYSYTTKTTDVGKNISLRIQLLDRDNAAGLTQLLTDNWIVRKNGAVIKSEGFNSNFILTNLYTATTNTYGIRFGTTNSSSWILASPHNGLVSSEGDSFCALNVNRTQTDGVVEDLGQGTVDLGTVASAGDTYTFSGDFRWRYSDGTTAWNGLLNSATDGAVVDLYMGGNTGFAVNNSKVSTQPDFDFCRSRQQVWNDLQTTLLDAGIDYNIVHPDAVKDAVVTPNGEMQIGYGSYRYLVMPRMEIIPSNVLQKVCSFQASGGTVFWVDVKPQAGAVASEDTWVKTALSNAVPVAPETLPGNITNPYSDPLNLTIDSGANLVEVARFLREGKWIYYLVNRMGETVNVAISVSSSAQVKVYDPSAGTVTNTSLPRSLTLTPYKGLLIVYSP